ncbi:MAG TPA: dynamin family protein [Kofleriaceae bacterium]|nr:dynamin family protein [Kofleriaceae bacterium]
MQSFSNSKQTLIGVLDQLIGLAARRDGELADELRQELEHLSTGELNVVVCGECKRGKSSLINAFLEEVDLCPPDAPVATNAITVIRHAERERIVVSLQDAAGRVTTKDIARAEIRQFVTEQGNTRNRQRVQLLQIWLSNPRLKDGLVLFDTPGVGSLHVEHTAATQGIIPYADAVLFVCAANEPLSEPEASFAAGIARYTPHLLLVVTKRDSVANAEAILRANLDKLRSKLGRDDLHGVAVSSYLKHDHLESRDADDLRRSGFPDLERGLWQLLAQRGEILVGRAQDRALQAMFRLRVPAEVEHKALSTASAEELKALDVQLQAMIRRGEDLASDSALWLNELNHRMSMLQNNCSKNLAGEFADLAATLDLYLAEDRYLHHPDALASQLTVDCNNVVAAILRTLEAESDQIVRDLRSSTQLEVIAGADAVPRGVALELSRPIAHPADSALMTGSTIGRKIALHSSGLGMSGFLAGAVIGGIIGTFVAPGVGTLGGAQAGAWIAGSLGTLVGGVFGLKRGITERAERLHADRRQQLGALCRDQLASARATISHELTTLLLTTRSTIQDSLLREIRRDQRACKEAAAALAERRHKTQAEASARLRELGIALTQLGRLEAAVASAGGEGTGVH